MSSRKGPAFSAARIAARVAALGKEVSREYDGRRVDVVITLDRGFVFAADLMRQIDAPVVCHFVHEDVRDVEHSGHARREVFFGAGLELKGRDVLLVDAVLESGVTQEFLLRRLGESKPRSIRLAVMLDKPARRRVALEPDSRSIRLAVMLDKPARRRVALEPDYFGFRTASNLMWVGYGLAAANGTGRNLQQLSSAANGMHAMSGRGRKNKARV